MTNGMNTGTPNMFKCPFDCDFLNEEQDIYLLHLTEDHEFERNSHVQQNESCNECEFTYNTKADLEKHTSEYIIRIVCYLDMQKEHIKARLLLKYYKGCFNILSIVTFQMRRKTFCLYI